LQIQQFDNIGYWHSAVDPVLLEPVWDEIRAADIPDNLPQGYNKKIFCEQSKPQLEQIVFDHLNQYRTASTVDPFAHCLSYLDQTRPLKLGEVWINFMTNGYYEPIHPHPCVATFVLWLQIPYTIQSEHAQRPWIDHRWHTSGCFAIHPQDVTGHMRHVTLPSDQNWENTICLFPAELNHSVFPFITPGIRISIAGNLFYDSSNS